MTLLSSWLGFASGQQQSPELQHFFHKDKVTIAITDSGLGGLSVMAEAAARLKVAGVFKKVDLVFFNALFSTEGGYNSLRTREEKIKIFSSALESLEQDYYPDLILIGCNTLSVLYEDTPFARKTKVPVVGIVEAGVELMAEVLRQKKNSIALLFGTPTTVEEAAHQGKLAEMGVNPGRIILQACPELELYIEKNYASDETEMLIAGCVEEALQKAQIPQAPLYVSLNCTHYGYSLPLWEKAFAEAGIKPLAILNPNSRMIDFLFAQQYLNRYSNTEISAHIVSMVGISGEKIEFLGQWLSRISPEIAEALQRYEHNPSLFEWKKHRRKKGIHL